MATLQDKIKDLRRQGRSFSSIANELGTTRGTVAGVLNRAGMVGEGGSDKIEAGRPADDVFSPEKTGAFTQAPPTITPPPGQAPAMRPMAIDPALNNLPQWPIGRAPAMPPQFTMPGRTAGMPPQAMPVPPTPGNAPGMQPITGLPKPGPLSAPTTPAGPMTGPSIPNTQPRGPWDKGFGGTGNSAPVQSVPNASGTTLPNGPPRGGPWQINQPRPTAPPAPPTPPTPGLLSRIGSAAGASMPFLWPATDLAQRKDVYPSIEALAKQHTGTNPAQAAQPQGVEVGKNGINQGTDTSGDKLDIVPDAPRSPLRMVSGGEPPQIDKFAPESKPIQTTPMSDAYSQLYSTGFTPPPSASPFAPATMAATPGASPAPAWWQGTAQANQPAQPAQQPQMAAPHSVQPYKVPASQVPSQPIGGQNPYGNPMQPLQQQLQRTQPPNNGMQPGQGNQQNNPIASIVKNIVGLPANVVQGIQQGLNQYTTMFNSNGQSAGQTNTPGQVSQMSTNIANGQPPQPGGMTPPPQGYPGWQPNSNATNWGDY